MPIVSQAYDPVCSTTGSTGCNLTLASDSLVIRFFGGFEARRDGLPLPRTRTRKDVWLLALLALRNRQPLDRTWLAGTLWPESAEKQSLGYLRSSLYILRCALGKEAIRLTSPSARTVALDLTGAEVRYLMRREWARFPDDVLWRRSKLGLTMPQADREALAAFMATAD